MNLTYLVIDSLDPEADAASIRQGFPAPLAVQTFRAKERQGVVVTGFAALPPEALAQAIHILVQAGAEPEVMGLTEFFAMGGTILKKEFL